ncbi:MAG TPA: bifunctional phosphoglucose/phosphomannose isomerase [Candidatus Binatia bacterium]|nr:bifunctional phosphoglucose/phosphomannose isomerase [Candidatus Binatia bacterium]
MTLDDPALIERTDPHRSRDVLAAFPAQCRAALTLRAAPALSLPRPSLVVLAGMGGSAAGADLIAGCAAERLDVPIIVHRGYGLPPTVGPHALVVASSYSGDTVEVLSAAEAALERAAPIVALTAGGRLEALATGRGLPLVRLPAGLMPRMALGYLFFPALRILGDVGLAVAPDTAIAEALEVVTGLADELAPSRPVAQNEAKRLALAIGARLPAIYGGPSTGGVAYRWKTDVEENAKRFAIAGAVPEMNHNEIEAWRAPAAATMHAVFLRDRDESSEIGRRFAVLRELIAAGGGDVSECWARGVGRPARLLGLAYLGAWTSYYLAVGRGTDPWPVPVLDEMKRRLRAT